MLAAKIIYLQTSKSPEQCCLTSTATPPDLIMYLQSFHPFTGFLLNLALIINFKFQGPHWFGPIPSLRTSALYCVPSLQLRSSTGTYLSIYYLSTYTLLAGSSITAHASSHWKNLISSLCHIRSVSCFKSSLKVQEFPSNNPLQPVQLPSSVCVIAAGEGGRCQCQLLTWESQCDGTCALSFLFNSFLTVTGKFSAMIRTLLYVFGSHEGHFKLKRKRCTYL